MTERDGRFNFTGLAPGVYLLDVLDTIYQWPQVKVNIPAEAADNVRALEYVWHGAPKSVAAYPLRIEALGKISYDKPEKKFSPMSLMRNPMAMMMCFTLFIVIVFPKMLANMDPEEMKKMQSEMQMSDPQDMINKFLGKKVRSRPPRRRRRGRRLPSRLGARPPHPVPPTHAPPSQPSDEEED